MYISRKIRLKILCEVNYKNVFLIKSKLFKDL